MSLFRKPKKIQRRVFCADDDEDGDGVGEPEAPPPPLISHKRDKKENKSVKAPKLLSFADEEEECEEFKVKKSSQSKRLAKRREKERNKAPECDNDEAFHKDIEFPEDRSSNTSDQEENRNRKKVTLEGMILSGRAALSAEGAGDVSDSGDEAEPGGFHKYRAESLRAALAVAPGPIPDAALIHAARKTRQQARELGDFAAVGAEGAGSGRSDADDSGDDGGGRLAVRGLHLPSDRPTRDTAAQSDDEEAHSEGERWERQQLHKALAPLADAAAAPPPPPRAPPPAAPASAADLLLAWRRRLRELRDERDAARERRARLEARLAAAAEARAARAERRAALDATYRRAQAARGYFTDLIECLDEKMPALEALEARALAVARRRRDFLVERRRADVRDQAQDALGPPRGGPRPADPEDKVRRAAEREGRRRARRLRREAAGAAAAAAHRDGDSSDDDLPPGERDHLDAEIESIRAARAELFADALPAWRTLRGVAERAAAWRRSDRALYADAHAPAALPKLLAPYVRHELVLWNPLADADNDDYERMEWFRCLIAYGAEAADEERELRDDPDLMLLPTLVEKVVLPKVAELVECAWDPMCVRACVRLRGVVTRAAGAPRASGALRRLGAAARARLDAALAADVFLPPQCGEGGGGAFWRRCLGGGVRLLRGALALTGPPRCLGADAVVLRLVDTLCVASGAAGGPAAALAATALADSLPRSGELRARALRRVAALARRALQLLADCPLHLKAIERCRAVIAEARAAD